MLEKIAEVVGIRFDESDLITTKILQRIQDKIPPSVTVGDPIFSDIVKKAEEDVDAEGQMAIVTLVKQIMAPPPDKILKIKSSPKGVRIKIASSNGIHFSFGPIWNESVKKAKGIALAEVNRLKLNHQAMLVGVKSPEKMQVQELCGAIAKML